MNSNAHLLRCTDCQQRLCSQPLLTKGTVQQNHEGSACLLRHGVMYWKSQ